MSSKIQVPSCKKSEMKIKSSCKMQVLSCKKEELYNRRDLELLMSLAPLKDQSLRDFMRPLSILLISSPVSMSWSRT